MKGIILAGGNATRLYPCTREVSKQMLPVYKVPMIFYPLNILIKAGIKDIMIISSRDHGGDFNNLLDPMMRDFGIQIHSRVQEVPRGIPEAFTLGDSFVGDDNVALILGDNIFEDADLIAEKIRSFKSGGHVFGKKVKDPERFGVATVDKNGKVVDIFEKPKKPKSNIAVTGAYIYDNRVIKKSRKLKPSKRGEFEIVDLHNFYLKKGELSLTELNGKWLDAGTFDSLLEASILAKKKKLFKKFDPKIKKAIKKRKEEYKAMADRMLGK